MGRHRTLKAPEEGPSRGNAEPISSDQALADAIPSPETLLSETAVLLQRMQKAIDDAIKAGTATPALARESASVARAIAILSKELRDREKATRDRFEKLTDRERHELAIDLVCSLPKAVRVEARRRLDEGLTKGAT